MQRDENEVATYFWTFPFSCPDCNKPGTIMDVSINSLSVLLLEGLCVVCGKNLEAKIKVDGTLIRRLCENDMTKDFEMSLNRGEENTNAA